MPGRCWPGSWFCTCGGMVEEDTPQSSRGFSCTWVPRGGEDTPQSSRGFLALGYQGRRGRSAKLTGIFLHLGTLGREGRSAKLASPRPASRTCRQGFATVLPALHHPVRLEGFWSGFAGLLSLSENRSRALNNGLSILCAKGLAPEKTCTFCRGQALSYKSLYKMALYQQLENPLSQSIQVLALGQNIYSSVYL